jgi:hypothetical protein
MSTSIREPEREPDGSIRISEHQNVRIFRKQLLLRGINMNRWRMCVVVLFLVSPLAAAQNSVPKPAQRNDTVRNRVIILTDIGADPDDTMSLVRLLTYSNVVDIKGLVATTSTFQKNRIEPESIKRVLDAYRAAWPNLVKHEPGYPPYGVLLARLKSGLAVYGMEGVGEGKDSEGSDLIVSELKSSDSRPLWISVWGGTTVLAQALWRIRKDYPAATANELYRRLRVYAISDQDDTGSWIRKEFPAIF